MADQQRVEVTVSAGTLAKVVVAVALVALVVFLRDVVALIIVATVLAVLMSPVADLCERHRLPRALGVGAVYVAVLGILGAVTTLLAQPIIVEVRGLAGSLPVSWERLVSFVEAFRAFSVEHGLADRLRELAGGIEGQVANGVFGALTGAFGGVVSLLLVLVLTFYLTTYATVARRTLIGLAPTRWQPFLIGVVPRIERKMGAWLRGLLALAVIMGVLAFIGLTILRVPYALVLAVLTAIAEIVPYVGPVFAAVVAVLLTLIQSPVKALIVLIFYIVAQQIENHLLVPKVMQRAVGVNPVVSLLALLIGVQVGGIAGALLAIPIVAGLSVFFEEYARERRSQPTVDSR